MACFSHGSLIYVLTLLQPLFLSLLRKPVLSIDLESFYEFFGEGLEEDQGTKKVGNSMLAMKDTEGPK